MVVAAAIAPLTLVGSSKPSQRVETSPTVSSRSAPTATVPVPTTTTGPPKPARTLAAQAEQLLDAVVVPPGAQRVQSLPGDVFQASPQGSSCTGAVDEYLLWTVAESPSKVDVVIRSGQRSWITTSGTATESNTKTHTTAYITLDDADWSAPAAPQSDQVNFVVAAISDTVTGIRADAIMVPPSAGCPSAG